MFKISCEKGCQTPGNELSGNHFAVVLNKNSPKAGEITVLPLTSKANKSNINLGNELI